MSVFIHETAIVDEGAELGTGTKVWHWVHICSTAKIGENCNFGQNVFIAGGVEIGKGVKIQNNVSVYEGVILEDYVFCGPSMVFTNVMNPRSEVNRKNEYRKTIVGRGASIGANATVVCGNNIGKYAFIGAGSLITKEVPDHALMFGVPARLKGWMCKCGEKLPLELGSSQTSVTCTHCDQNYQHENGKIREG